MGGKTSKHGSENATGKSGNASGSNVQEARGPAYEHRQGELPSDKNEQHQGKHPPNTMYKGPKDLHPAGKQRGNRQSTRSALPRPP